MSNGFVDRMYKLRNGSDTAVWAADRITELEVLIEQHKVLIEEQGKKIKRLREALDRYGAHDFECPYLNLTPHLQPCNCGYSKALKEVSDE